MAFTTNGVLNTVVDRYMSGLASVPDSWSLTVDRKTADAAALRLPGMTALGAIPEWNGTTDLSGSATSVDEYNTTGITLTAQQYGAQIAISRLDLANVAESLSYASQKLGFAVANTYADLVYTKWAGAFPGTGSINSGDGKAIFADDHPVSGGGTRSTKLTSALDSSALMAAVKLARNFKSFDGSPYDLTAGGFYLVVPPSLEEAAHQAIRSSFVLSQPVEKGTANNQFQPPAAQGLNNVAGNFYNPVDIIVSPHFESHTAGGNDWFIVSKVESPLVFWERLAPEIRVTQDEDTLKTKLTVDFAVACGGKADPALAIGSIVS